MLALGKEIMATQPKEAKKLFDQVLSVKPDSIAGLEYMSDYYASCERGGIETAISYLEKAYKLNRRNNALCMKLAKLVERFDRGKNRDPSYAKKLLESIIASDPRDPAARAALGEFLRKEGNDLDRARKLLKESLDIQKSPDALASYGHLLLIGAGGLEKDVERARSHFDAALILDPEHELALQGREQIFDEISLEI
jgi:tetratricopeptide (TPR) repeat protein